MTAEIFTIESTTCTIVTGLTGPPEVTVSYEGTAAPLTIFMHLAALGFEGLAPQPPPVDAIDWTTPDPVRGTTHTVRPYPAVSVGRYEGPTPDRDRAVDAARLIFERLTRSTLPPPPPSAAVPTNGTAASRRPPPAVAAVATPPPRRPEATVAAAPAPGPDDASPATTATDDPASVRAFVIDADMARGLGAILSQFGEITEERPTTWTTEGRYRGQVTETHHRAVRFTVSVPVAAEVALIEALAKVPVRSSEIVVPAAVGAGR